MEFLKIPFRPRRDFSGVFIKLRRSCTRFNLKFLEGLVKNFSSWNGLSFFGQFVFFSHDRSFRFLLGCWWCFPGSRSSLPNSFRRQRSLSDSWKVSRSFFFHEAGKSAFFKRPRSPRTFQNWEKPLSNLFLEGTKFHRIFFTTSRILETPINCINYILRLCSQKKGVKRA